MKAYAWSLEADSVTLPNSYSTPVITSVTFSQSYSTPPVVVALATNIGGDPAAVRVFNITTSGFQIILVEPNAEDGPHAAMTVPYIVVEPGINTLPDGTIIAAGTLSVFSVQHGNGVTGAEGWQTLSYGTAFVGTPAVLAALQTRNSESANPPSTSSIPFLTTAIRNVGTTSSQVALERSESGSGTVSAETVGWIAMQSGQTGSFTDSGGTSISFNAIRSSDSIVGWDNPCVTVSFSAGFTSAPIAVGVKNTHDGGDGGWLRRCSLSSAAIGFEVDEDRDNDTERAHTTERAGILAFSRAFGASFGAAITILKSLIVENDPVNGTTNPFSLPGAELAYTLLMQNTGTGPTDSGSVSVIDALPVDTSLFITDIDGPMSGPLRVSQGAPSSTLGYVFSGFPSTIDNVDFSDDGGATFTYQPTDSGDGTDPGVTHIRINFSGAFAANGGGAAPSVSVLYRTKVN